MRDIRVTSDGTSHRTKITNAETGDEIKGISRVKIEITHSDIVRATLDLVAPQIDTRGKAEYRVSSPKTGELKKVRKIEFADGEIFEF
jgi:hypothetical protein